MSEIYVCLCALSDPVQDISIYQQLVPVFAKQGIRLELSDSLMQELTPELKARVFNHHLRSERYDWIVDVSGGDLANLVLPYLDYEAYANSRSWFAAFSDGTCIVNALSACSHKKAMLFPFWLQSTWQQSIDLFKTGRIECEIAPMGNDYWPRHARVYGGNLRCLLKLAGTGRMPDMSGGYLLLEANSGSWYRFESMAAQLSQCGVFDHIRGFILGHFSQLERSGCERKALIAAMKNYLESLVDHPVGFYTAENLGHITNSQGLWISAVPEEEPMEARPAEEKPAEELSDCAEDQAPAQSAVIETSETVESAEAVEMIETGDGDEA